MKSYRITAIVAVLALAAAPVQFKTYADSDRIQVNDIIDIIPDNNIKSETTVPQTTTTSSKITTTSAVSKATTETTVTTMSVSSSEQSVKPVYDEFDENDVNGEIIVNIPENVTADVEITFDSPEVTDEPYYTANLNGGQSYFFAVEGRDNTESDYRTYTVNVALKGGKYDIKSAVFTDEITVPDGNDNQDSYTKYTYTFTVDDEFSKNEWDIASQSGTTKTIAVHLDDIAMGDLNRDGMVNAADASAVLAEYSLLSTSGDSSFTEKQKLEADTNKDSVINAKDASNILEYYSYVSIGGKDSFEKFMSAE
ncbi:MAG: hypothetical protein K2G83_00330 [Ruminococcus sp.]|nr:hypothetical protein [Ruminococcus sp.]